MIGILCANASQVVSFSVQRDAVLNSEDHVRVVLGPFADGRSGYVFAVNPTGAGYDAMINPGGESDNPVGDPLGRQAAGSAALITPTPRHGFAATRTS